MFNLDTTLGRLFDPLTVLKVLENPKNKLLTASVGSTLFREEQTLSPRFTPLTGPTNRDGNRNVEVDRKGR